MNLTESIAPKSDQLNADDLISGPVTVTVADVTRGTAEQPVNVMLVEFPGRAYRPSKSMRRVLVMAWGAEAADYAGHKLTLFRNAEIAFGGSKVGGIEISHMSHLDKPLTVALTATRGKRKNFTVQPLAPEPKQVQRDWLAELVLAGDSLEAVKALGNAAIAAKVSGQITGAIRARVKEIEETPV